MFSVHQDVAGHMGDLSANQAFWQLVSSHPTGLINHVCAHIGNRSCYLECCPLESKVGQRLKNCIKGHGLNGH
jgi:hypothetical protein